MSRRRLLGLTGAGLLGVAAAGRVSADEHGEDGGDSDVDGSGPDQVADDGPVGGGDGYHAAVAQDDADVVAGSLDELSNALSSASPGDLVFVPGDASIDLGSTRLSVPAGVTLASNRGVDGSSGALLSTGAEPDDLITLHEGSRVTGLRLHGPHPGDDRGGSDRSRALTVLGEFARIDNNEIQGFSYAGIYVLSGGALIHHNVVQECNKAGLGYGVSQSSGYNLVEYNYFNHNRHSVASDGEHYGYVCRYNHFGPLEYKHNIDAHDPACVRLAIHNNVVETVERLADDNVNTIVAIRGVPDEGAEITDNWFFNDRAPDPNGPTDRKGQVVKQSSESSWTNVSFSDNVYGEDADVGYADVIPGYTGWRTA